MNHFTISDIENLTRIKAHTLRIWEKRYQLITPKRTASGHRFYDGEDLKTMLRIAWLYENGHKISQIAKFSFDEIKERALGFGTSVLDPEQHLNKLMEASIDFNAVVFKDTLDRAVADFGFEKMIMKVAFPFMKKIGLLWLTGHLIPAQEHFASTLLVQRILLETDRLPAAIHPHAMRTVLLFTPPGEYHEVPLLYVNYLLKKQGVPSIYFGANVSCAMLASFCRVKKIKQLYFHLITNFTKIDLMAYLQELSGCTSEQEIYFSGIRPGIEKPLPPRVFHLDSNEAILQFIG